MSLACCFDLLIYHIHVICVCRKGHLSKVPTARELGVVELHPEVSENDMNHEETWGTTL